jgi:hypothetical protein
MRKLNSFEESKYFITILSLIDQTDKSKFIDWINTIPNNLKISRSKIMIKIIRTNGSARALDIYDAYIKSNSQSEKVLMAYGLEELNTYKHKLKNRPKPKYFSVMQKDYWMIRVGLTEEDAKKKVSEFQLKQVRARSKASYKDTKLKLKACVEYWTNMGYSPEEGEILRQQHLYLND